MNNPHPVCADKLRTLILCRMLAAVLAVAWPALAGSRRADARRCLMQGSVPAVTKIPDQKARKLTAREKVVYRRALKLLFRHAGALGRRRQVRRPEALKALDRLHLLHRQPAPKSEPGATAPGKTEL